MSLFICRALYKWLAQYLHSRGHLKEAVSYYEKANDILAVTKIYCSLNKVEKASLSWFLNLVTGSLLNFCLLSLLQLFCMLLLWIIFTNCISEGRNAMTSWLSTRPFVSTLSLEPSDRQLTLNFCMYLVTIVYRGLKVKIIGQGQGHGSG